MPACAASIAARSSTSSKLILIPNQVAALLIAICDPAST